VASPSCGRADDKAVAAWAACGGREDRWHAVAGMPGARWRLVAEPLWHHRVRAGWTRSHGPSWATGT
jgi:hypothetical protein